MNQQIWQVHLNVTDRRFHIFLITSYKRNKHKREWDEEPFTCSAWWCWLSWKCTLKATLQYSGGAVKQSELTYVWMIQYLHYSDFPEELLRHRKKFFKEREGHDTAHQASQPLFCWQERWREHLVSRAGPNRTENPQLWKCVHKSANGLDCAATQKCCVGPWEATPLTQWHHRTKPWPTLVRSKITTPLTHSSLACSPST